MSGVNGCNIVFKTLYIHNTKVIKIKLTRRIKDVADKNNSMMLTKSCPGQRNRAKAPTCARDRCALQQLALNVHVNTLT